MAPQLETFADAVAHYQANRLDAAERICRQTLEMMGNHPDALHLLGIISARQGNYQVAVDCFNRVLAVYPNWAEVHGNLGNALREQGKLDEAEISLRRALQLQPNFAPAYNNLGAIYKVRRNRDLALTCFRRAVEIDPNFFVAIYNLGIVASNQGKFDEAAACLRRALQLKPDFAGARCDLAHQLQQMCQWDELPGLAQGVVEAVDKNLVIEGVAPVSPFSFMALPTITTAQQQWRCAQQWSAQLLKAVRSSGDSPLPRYSGGEGPGVRGPAPAEDLGFREGPLPHTPALSPGVPGEREKELLPPGKEKFTVGYLSADFHSHATAFLIAELIEKHDRERFQIYGYSYGPDDGSPMRRRVAGAFDRFVDVANTSFAEAARRIAADGVDILVDLKGYTGDARTEILAARPAPIQVNYLGYPGTMGAPFMDYIVVDPFIVPPDQQPFFTEKLVHLPGCYQVNDSQRPIATHTPSRGECGLPESGFVFCSLNSNYKITADVFAVWMRLLNAVPGSVLWLLESNRFASANLRREAEARGIDKERLVFAPPCSPAEHLARHRLADLFLDTFPVTAHTTASDALWAECPLLTIAGETFVSRVAASLLHTLVLPELVATSLADYEATALRLAQGPALLADLRARLGRNRLTSGLFDAGRFARKIENAYATMWQIYAAGEKPRLIAVAPSKPSKDVEAQPAESVPSKKMLHLGCGRTILTGWINLDRRAGDGVDVVADFDACAANLLPFASDTFDEFLTNHLFERLKNPMPFMQELHRIAKPGARAVFHVAYGSSDDALEDPARVRQCFLQTFSYFSQPAQWQADGEYQGDWQVDVIRLLVAKKQYDGKSHDEIMNDVMRCRNVVREMIVEIVAVKPIRQRRRDLQSPGLIEVVLVDS